MKILKNKGKFWLPDSPDHKVEGEFELIEGTLGYLKLEDLIDKSVSKNVYFNECSQRMQHPLILGELKDGHCVALLQSSFRSISISPELSYKYNIHITIDTGRLLIESEKGLHFKKISFSFDHLPQYLGACDIKSDFPDNFQHITTKYTNKKDHFELNDSLSCTFYCNFKYTHDSLSHETHLYPLTLIEIDSTVEIAIQSWLSIIEKNIGAFFSIIVGKYLCPTRIRVFCEFESKPYKFGVFYRYFNRHSDLSRSKGNCLKSMMPDLTTYLANFYAFYQAYPLIIDNYFTLYRFDSILEYEYLSAVYSIESFSRYTNPNHYFFPSDEFKNTYLNPLKTHIKNTLTNETNFDYIERLNNAIKYSNELSLRALLKQLMNNNKNIIDRIISDKVDNLTKDIVNNRNWYTHFTKELEPLAAEGSELYRLYVKVRVLFEVCLFKHLQMPDDLIVKTIKETYLFE